MEFEKLHGFSPFIVDKFEDCILPKLQRIAGMIGGENAKFATRKECERIIRQFVEHNYKEEIKEKVPRRPTLYKWDKFSSQELKKLCDAMGILYGTNYSDDQLKELLDEMLD